MNIELNRIDHHTVTYLYKLLAVSCRRRRRQKGGQGEGHVQQEASVV